MNRIIIATAACIAIATAAVLSANANAAPATVINPADYQASPNINNPLLPLSSFKTLTFEGTEEDPDTGDTIETRVVWTILPDAKTVAGVNVLVLRDDAYADGELVESTLDYFAQHNDGSVYYFGEDVDNYENGVLTDHDGSWLAGVGANEPGVFMPTAPVAGQTFDQERAPGIAEDHSKILGTGLSETVPAGSFTGCIKTEDENPLDAAAAKENKWYCPGAGLIRESAPGELLELVSIEKAPAPVATAVPATAQPVAAAPTVRPAGVTAPNTGNGGDSRVDDAALYAIVAGVVLAAGAVGVAAGRQLGVRTKR